MSDISRVAESARYARSVSFNGTVHLTGITAKNRVQDIAEQTGQVLAALDQHLANAGTDKTRLLSVHIILREIDRDFRGMNMVWDQWVDAEAPPSRATFQGQLAHPDILIEIIATAALPAA